MQRKASKIDTTAMYVVNLTIFLALMDIALGAAHGMIFRDLKRRQFLLFGIESMREDPMKLVSEI
jgi:hypothetical protein